VSIQIAEFCVDQSFQPESWFIFRREDFFSN
jgi:hypothetical protein